MCVLIWLILNESGEHGECGRWSGLWNHVTCAFNSDEGESVDIEGDCISHHLLVERPRPPRRLDGETECGGPLLSEYVRHTAVDVAAVYEDSQRFGPFGILSQERAVTEAIVDAVT